MYEYTRYDRLIRYRSSYYTGTGRFFRCGIQENIIHVKRIDTINRCRYSCDNSSAFTEQRAAAGSHIIIHPSRAAGAPVA